jgi:6-bladed beta-propeller protein
VPEEVKISMRIALFLVTIFLFAQFPRQVDRSDGNAPRNAEAHLLARIEASPTLPFHGVPFAAVPPAGGWESGAVSWLAVDHAGTIYEIQRGNKASPILVLNQQGKVLRSWGNGDYEIPHSIRIDPAGNIWTVDAALSTVTKYSPSGKKLMTIRVGEQPETGSPFHGATDVAFGSNGHIFITDGYGNARVLEYTRDRQRIKQWGKPGTGPGEFRLPHAIQIDENGTVYIADRENGRIQKFDLSGDYLGEISHLGRIYSLKVVGEALWASTGPVDQPPGSSSWVLKLDRKTGQILGHLEVPEPRGGHSVEQMPSGEPIITFGNQLLWFKTNLASSRD